MVERGRWELGDAGWETEVGGWCVRSTPIPHPPSPASLSRKCLQFCQRQRREVVLDCLGAADQRYVAAFAQQQLGRTQLAVVVEAHGLAVRAGIVKSQQIANLDRRQRPVDRELVVVLT